MFGRRAHVRPCSISEPNHKELTAKIMKGIFSLPEICHANSDCASFISELMQPEPTRRLAMRPEGIQNVKNHGWFSTIDWFLMPERKFPPPYTPAVNNKQDCGTLRFVQTTLQSKCSTAILELAGKKTSRRAHRFPFRTSVTARSTRTRRISSTLETWNERRGRRETSRSSRSLEIFDWGGRVELGDAPCEEKGCSGGHSECPCPVVQSLISVVAKYASCI